MLAQTDSYWIYCEMCETQQPFTLTFLVVEHFLKDRPNKDRTMSLFLS